MYHCRIHFYLLGRQSRMFEIIKEMPPFEHFTHEYMESSEPEEALASKADVILANLQGLDAEKTVQALIQAKPKEAELILLAEKEQLSALTEEFGEIKDIWSLPLSEEEIRFHFFRWQQSCKMGKDFWQTSQYLETTINHVPNLIWYKDKDGIHEKVNDSFCKTVNKTKQQVQGSGHAYIWDVESDDPACIESEREVMEGRKTCVSEEIIQTGAGERTLITYKSPLYDLDSSVMGTVGVGIDVTQERLYEQEIIHKNQTLEKVFTTIDCGVMLHTLDGKRVISVNRAALKILGYESQEELMADGFDMVAGTVMEEDKPKLRKCIKTLKKEGDVANTGYRVQHKDGRILHVMGNAKLLKENGEMFYQRFLLDCTEQKLQEKENAKQRELLIRALSIDYDVVCYFDLDKGTGDVLRNNNEEGSVFLLEEDGKVSFAKSVECYIQKLVYEDDREMLAESLSKENLIKELEEKKMHYVNYRVVLNGQTQYFQTKAARTGDWNKQHDIVLGLRSVDEEMRIEIEKQNVLEDALAQANRASKAKSAFLSNMSHDIRTPMNAIVGFTALASTHIDEKQLVAEYLQKIMASGNHLLSLINDVLDMSRIESGKMHLDEKPCSLPDILHGLRNILQADIRAKQLELYIDAVDIVNEEIFCDKLRLNQVLLNLLSNAVKYTTAGGMISMRIIEKAGAPAGYAHYEFRIRDTGIGMSEDFVARIFEPFEREKNSTTSGIQGTGLGMAITKNIVDMMNGTIDVKSQPEKGTEITVCFTFRLNADVKEVQPIPQLKNSRALMVDDDVTEEEEKESDGEDAVKRRTGRILLAEDNELNQEIAKMILEDAGFSVEVADNGQIAVDMLGKSEPGYYQLVLMDVQMPVMNGYEATKRIRALDNPGLSSIPIFAMTANAFEEDKQEALIAGMNGHLAKPINVEVLFDTLDKILN